MSQQEFRPESQKSQSQHGAEQDNEEIYPSHQYNQRRTSDMPKQDHPSTYDEAIPPYSYQAQDKARSAQQQAQTSSEFKQGEPQSSQTRQGQRTSSSERGKASFEPDGDAFETGYRPHAQRQWQFAPPWARPQQPRGRTNWGKILIVTLLILFVAPFLLKMLLILFTLFIIFAFGFLMLLLILLAGFIYIMPRHRRRRWWW